MTLAYAWVSARAYAWVLARGYAYAWQLARAYALRLAYEWRYASAYAWTSASLSPPRVLPQFRLDARALQRLSNMRLRTRL